MVRRERTALIYVRQSTYREESISPEVQVEQCLAHCRREGYRVVDEPVMDLDLSGRSFTKRKIQPIIDRVRTGEANVVVVWRWSRWGRNLVESLRCIAELRQAGGTLESATEPIDASTPAGRFSVTQMLAIAEFQSDQIGESWRDAMRNMLVRGLPPTGGPRFGYTYDRASKAYSIHPLAGPALRTCYQQYRDGKSFHALTLHLRGLGVTSSRGRTVTEAMLRLAMDSGFAAGLIRLDEPQGLLPEERLEELGAEPGQPLFLRGKWEPLIDEGLWLAYQERRRTQRAKPRRGRNPRLHLAGHLRCTGCGRRMLYRPERSRWVCCTQLTKGTKDCPVHVSVDHAEATDFVKEWLRELAAEHGASFDALVAQRMAAQTAHGDRAALERQLIGEEKRKENLVRAVADEVFEAADVAAEMRSIKNEIERLKRALADLRARQTEIQAPTDSFARLLDSWDLTDPTVVNQALSKILDGVYVYPFRSRPRMIARAVWETDLEVPLADAPDLDFSEGRLCLGCHEWKPRDQFNVRRRGNQLMSRCKKCKAQYQREWASRKQPSDNLHMTDHQG